MKREKTNAMRILDRAKIAYDVLYYEIEEAQFDGLKVAEILGIDPKSAYKTLALKDKNDLILAVIPVTQELDLKKLSKAVDTKSVTMVHVKDLLATVGHTRGSVTPIDVRAKHKTVFHSSVLSQDTIEISGGKMGVGLTVSAKDIVSLLKATVADICKEIEDV